MKISRISIFDVFKIGVGPSSSHTLGPWRATLAFLEYAENHKSLSLAKEIHCTLFGSLAMTGRGHQTDKAIALGIMGYEPDKINTSAIDQLMLNIRENKKIKILNKFEVPFDINHNVLFDIKTKTDVHPNTLDLKITYEADETFLLRFYSTGGGFIKCESDSKNESLPAKPPFPAQNALDLLKMSEQENLSIAQLVYKNECFWHSEKTTINNIKRLWSQMQSCILNGIHTEGTLSGGLNVKRRAKAMVENLIGSHNSSSIENLIDCIKTKGYKPSDLTKWVSIFALAVNEENASMGRVVTSPTNGAAGVIPAVLMYAVIFEDKKDFSHIADFFCTAGEIGTLYIKEATISAAQGGCQAEIGVSSSMAAAALTQIMGGSADQVIVAAEIAMEHHLGLTCDPVGGLVQIPCIERNAMGAVKAITASQLALARNPKDARVTLDDVIETMWKTAQDMNDKYKETSKGGLAISVALREC